MKRIIILQIALCVSVAAAATDPNLVGWWKFDEGTGAIAYDSAGNNDGQLTNGPAWTTGPINGALSFDGVNDYISLGNPASLNFSGRITISAWINPGVISGTDINRNIVAHGYSSGYPRREVYLRINSNYYQVGEYIQDGSSTKLSYIIPLEDKNNWVHLVGLYDGATWRLYRNGVEVSSAEYPVGSIEVNADWAIGARGNGGSRFFTGAIDDVRIYNIALSETEVWALYEAGLPKLTTLEITGLDEAAEDFTIPYKAIAHYDNGDTNDVTALAEWWIMPDTFAEIQAGKLTTRQVFYPKQNLTIHARFTENEATVDAEKKVSVLAICPTGTALDFDGVNDYVRIPDSDSISVGNQDYTISAWINPRSLTGSDGAGTIVSKVKDGADKEYRFVLIDGDLHFDVENNSNNQFAQTNTALVEADDWQHVAVTFNSATTTPTFYYNGSVQTSTSSIDTLPDELNDDLYIGTTGGAYYNHINKFDGQIDDIRIYNRVLSEEEIGEIMFSKPVSSEPNLVAYWDFDDGSGQIATDVSGHGNDGTLGGSSEPDVADPCWVESDAPIGQCSTEQVMVRNLIEATEYKEVASQSIAEAINREQASMELIKQRLWQMRGRERRNALRAKVYILLAILQEHKASHQIDASIEQLEEALRLLGYEMDAGSEP